MALYDVIVNRRKTKTDRARQEGYDAGYTQGSIDMEKAKLGGITDLQHHLELARCESAKLRQDKREIIDLILKQHGL
jgi:flagellar biosynthesis/type III secretory pathway protein FliH